MEARAIAVGNAFEGAIAELEETIRILKTGASLKKDHVDLEKLIEERQRETSRLLLEAAFVSRGPGDVGSQVKGSDEVTRTHKRERTVHMKSIFGEVELNRTGYGAPGTESLFPLDGGLNLSGDSYSLNLRSMLCREVVKGSFDEAIAVVESHTGVAIPKRQAEELVQKAAIDFDTFYERRLLDPTERVLMERQPILVLTTDGKGIVMRPEGLREATRKRAEESESHLKKRLSKGEKRNAKRMAQVASLYSIGRHERSPEQVAGVEPKSEIKPPRPVGKRVWASVEKEQDAVIKDLFNEAEGRDPDSKMDWVVLVDGQLSQLYRVQEEAARKKVKITVIVDIVHVVEYVWKAARCLYDETDPKGEEWVTEHLLQILRGNAKTAAAGMRRSATFRGLKTSERGAIDICAEYLHKNADYLEYDQHLKKGYPIATGVIEGACRYLVKDRMDITGARWGLKGAEAVLKLRSLHASGDLDEYWAFHHSLELERNHESKYAKPAILRKNGLQLIK